NAVLDISGQTFQITYTSNSVVLTRVAPTTIVLTVSPSTSVYGQPVTLTAVVAPALVTTATGTPTGAVTFMDGSATLGTGTLNGSGVATFTTTTPLAGGSHVLTATYNGDGRFAPNTSAPLSLIVNRSVTVTSLSSSGNTFVFRQPVTFTAAVAALVGTPTGNVTFNDGSTILGIAARNSSGLATLTTSALSPGAHTITADYSGDGNFTGSTSGPLTQIVNQAPTAIAVSASLNPSVFGQPVSFSAA